VTSRAERKRKSDANPVDFCRRSLTGSNTWDSLADFLKILKLQGVGADDIKEVREIVQQLFANIVKPEAWQSLLDLQLADRFDKDRPILLLQGS